MLRATCPELQTTRPVHDVAENLTSPFHLSAWRASDLLLGNPSMVFQGVRSDDVAVAPYPYAIPFIVSYYRVANMVKF